MEVSRTWVRTAVALGGLAALAVAVVRLVEHPELTEGAFGLTLMLLGAAAALTRQFGIALPGRGFASFVLAAVLAALLLRGWEAAVLVGMIGVVGGDLLLRRLRPHDALLTAAHVGFGTAAVGLLYAALGGALGAAALAAQNLLPLAVAVVLLPVIVNATFYMELAAAGVLRAMDVRLVLRWEAVIAAIGGALAACGVALATSTADLVTGAVLTVGLAGAVVLAHWVIDKAVRADELEMIQGLAGAVAAEVSIERSFARIQELTTHLVPWERMGFARYDAERHEMELVADTATTERLRFDAARGLTAEAVRRGRPVVAGSRAQAHAVLPRGEVAASEVLVPLYHGTQLVGLWSIRHGEPMIYREADAALLDLLAPQLALSLALSALLDPLTRSTDEAAGYVRRLRETGEALRTAAHGVTRTASGAEAQANDAATRAAEAVGSLEQVMQSIHETLGAAADAVKANQLTATSAESVHRASRDAVSQLHELVRTIEEGAAEVGRLREAAQGVEDFSSTIAQIANQTNLLALNATIEAARTGVHGKGFAVVADEVRKLAEQSGRAAHSMGRNAQETRRVIDRAAHVMEDLGARLNELTGVSSRWGQELGQVVQTASTARHTGERMLEIPRHNLALAEEAKRVLDAARAAAAGSADAAASVGDAARQQLRSLEELVRGAAELSRLAERLTQGTRLIQGGDGRDAGSPM